MPKFTTIQISLDQIAGRSPLNARPEHHDDDVAGLAATIEAVGLLQKITLVRIDDAIFSFEVLAGWRRTKALRLLAERGAWVEPFDAILFEGSDEDAIAASIAENTERRALHPAEEAEAFAMLSQHGQAPEAIARHFGVTVRHVKGRLRLAALCPEAIALWKGGALTLDAAQALSAGTHDQQRAILADKGYSAHEAWNIRSKLRTGSVRADDRRALFVGRDAYLAAGGRLDESLFEQFDYFRDEALLARLASEKLAAEGERVCAEEGWGFCIVDPDFQEQRRYDVDRRTDLLEGERERLDDLQAEIEELEDQDEPDLTAVARAERELREIHGRAALRAIPAAERAAKGIFVEIDEHGGLLVERGASRREEPQAASGVSGSRADQIVTDEIIDPPPAARPSKALEGFLAETRSRALADAVWIRPDLALVYAVAALAQPTGRVVHLRGSSGRPRHELARAAADCAGFGEAAMMLAKAPQGDVLVAFADLVARAVSVGEAPSTELAAAFAAAARRGSALAGHLTEVFDAERYFALAPKEACVAAIADMGGRCDAKKKADIAAFAAQLAADRAWLPPELRKHCPPEDAHDEKAEGLAPRDQANQAAAAREAAHPAHPSAHGAKAAETPDHALGHRAGQPPTPASLADAMRAAIEKDETDEDRWTRSIDAFLRTSCAFGSDLRVKASEIYEVWKARRSAEGADVCALQIFGRLVRSLGYDSHRYTNGVHYIGLAIALADQAAE